MRGMLYCRIFRSTIAHGKVTSLDISEAEALEGVVKIVTYEDVRGYIFPTSGHPFSMDPAQRDIADRPLLTDRIRYYGDEIAAVIAEDEINCFKSA